MDVKSTYNFVPAPMNDGVYFVEWANQVNHDVPFSDGESGEIEISITAKTPIFIRNGHSKDNKETSFSNYKEKYFIPGSSLKGMFRNVLEILSCSKLNKKMVSKRRYSFRDLTQGSLYMRSYNPSKVKAGWLKQKVDGEWEICECEDFYLIHHEEVDKALGTTFRKDFLEKAPRDKSAMCKYDLIKKKGSSLDIKFTPKVVDKRKKAIFDEEGEYSGRIVFTGQSSKRNEGKKPSGKVHEFVFVGKKLSSPIKVGEEQQDDFKFIYYNDESNNISKDWKYWRDKLEGGSEIPVFFTKNHDDKTLNHFGLAFMYKLPYNNSIHQMNPIKSYDDNLDMAETIFGRTADHKDDHSLKGRVFIGNAFSDNAKPVDSENNKKDIFATPKASYYPFYLVQDKNNNPYITYQDDGTLRGFKRYPVRTKISNRDYTEEQKKNTNVFSEYSPLCEGSKFNAKIRFHNLRKIEIGALISAITFNNQKNCFHSLGGAKSYGYGKVDVKIVGTKYLELDQMEYLLEFENAIGKDRLEKQLKELISMASNTKENTLEYPLLTKNNNEFIEYIKNKQNLKSFTSINDQNVELVSTIKEREKEQKDKEDKEKQQKEREKEIEKEIEILAENLIKTGTIEDLLEFIKNHPTNRHIPNFEVKLKELQILKKKEKANEMQGKKISGLTGRIEEDKKILNKMLENKYFSFSESQKDEIIENIKIAWKQDNKSFYKKKKLAKITEFPWTNIKEWIGETKAQDLYSELVLNK